MIWQSFNVHLGPQDCVLFNISRTRRRRAGEKEVFRTFISHFERLSTFYLARAHLNVAFILQRFRLYMDILVTFIHFRFLAFHFEKMLTDVHLCLVAKCVSMLSRSFFAVVLACDAVLFPV